MTTGRINQVASVGRGLSLRPPAQRFTRKRRLGWAGVGPRRTLNNGAGCFRHRVRHPCERTSRVRGAPRGPSRCFLRAPSVIFLQGRPTSPRLRPAKAPGAGRLTLRRRPMARDGFDRDESRAAARIPEGSEATSQTRASHHRLGIGFSHREVAQARISLGPGASD